MANKLFSELSKGAYNALTAYTVGDFVTYNGSSYACILNSTGNLPTNTTYWALLASKGDTGATGATGSQGAKGDKGDTGDTGAQGDPGMVWEGPWVTSTAYAVDDVVSNSGSSYICIEAHTSGTFATDLAAGKWQLVAQKGDTGPQGEQGETGEQGPAGSGIDAESIRGANVPAPVAGDDEKALVYDHDTGDFKYAEAGAVSSVNSKTGDVVLDADDIDDTSTTNKFTTAGDITKLAGIETAADVTDAGNVGSSIHGASAKATPVDADTVALIDSQASNVLKKLSWTNIKATLKTYFDTLYQPAGSTSLPKIKQLTIFETTGRFGSSTSGGTITFTSHGVDLDTTSTGNRYARLQWELSESSNVNAFNAGGVFSIVFSLQSAPTSGSAFFGIGDVTVAGTGHTFTNNHIGFKLTTSGSVTTLSATVANGTTESASALTTIANGDYLEVMCIINASNSVDFYWRKNGGSWSSATNISTNIPTSTSNQRFINVSVSNDNTATQNKINCSAATFER